jgi:polygalacturonase
MSGGVRNVLMYDVEIGNVKNALFFKSNLDRGGYISNVFVDSISIASVRGAVLRFETNYFGYRGGNSPAQYEHFAISRVKAGKAEGYGVYFDGPGVPYRTMDGDVAVSASERNSAYAIRDIKVSDFHVASATHPYYLFNTSDCHFVHCTIGDKVLPCSPRESLVRQICDVW